MLGFRDPHDGMGANPLLLVWPEPGRAMLEGVVRWLLTGLQAIAAATRSFTTRGVSQN